MRPQEGQGKQHIQSLRWPGDSLGFNFFSCRSRLCLGGLPGRLPRSGLEMSVCTSLGAHSIPQPRLRHCWTLCMHTWQLNLIGPMCIDTADAFIIGDCQGAIPRKPINLFLLSTGFVCGVLVSICSLLTNWAIDYLLWNSFHVTLDLSSWMENCFHQSRASIFQFRLRTPIVHSFD